MNRVSGSLAEKTLLGVAWLTVLLSVLNVIGSTYIGVRGFSPVLFADEWTMPMDTAALGGQYPLDKLWEQHNEHRIPFQKALELFSMRWFQDDQRFPVILNWFVEAAFCLAGAFFLRRFGGLTIPEWLTAVSIIAFCAFNPIAMQIFVWGMGPSFLVSFLASFVALASLTLYSMSSREGQPKGQWLALVVAGAFLAETNLASGVLVWVVLPVCGLLLGLRFRLVAGLSVAGALGIGVYLIGYRTPSNASDPLQSVRNFPQVAAFMQAQMGHSWQEIWPQAGDFLAASGFLLLLIFPLVAFLPFRRQRQPIQVFSWSLGVLMAMTSFVMALGRQVSGVAQAREGRYQIPALLFWFALALILMSLGAGLGRYRSAALTVLQVAFCAVMIKNLTTIPRLASFWSHDSYIKNMAGLTVELGVNDLPMIRHIYPDPTVVLPGYRMITAAGLVKPPFSEYQYIGKPIQDVFTLRVAGCRGTIQKVDIIAERNLERDIAAEGWVYTGRGTEQVRRVIGVTDEGWIVGFGVADQTQWHLAGTIPRLARKLFIYAMLPDGKSVCTPPLVRILPSPPPAHF